MKMRIPFRYAAAAGAAMLCAGAVAPGAGPAMYFEAEEFAAPGGWAVVQDRECSGFAYLIGSRPDTPAAGEAATVFSLPASAALEAWVLSKNYASNMPGRRRFSLAVDGKAAEKEAGTHGRDGWAWERVGTFKLAAGPHVLGLRDTSRCFARCDAVLLAPAGFNPASKGRAALLRCRAPADAALPVKPELRPAGLASPGAFAPAAEIAGERVRVEFAIMNATDGRRVLARRVSLRSGDAWRALPVVGGEMLFLLDTDAAGLNSQGLLRTDHPAWPGTGVVALPGGGGRAFSGVGQNPFLAGRPRRLDPVAISREGGKAVVVRYRAADGLEANVRWSAREDGASIRCEAGLEAPGAGYYSVGFCAFEPLAREAVEAVQLPPLFQYQRLPRRPCVVSSALTPNPLALVQSRAGGAASVTWGVAAEPGDLPFRWAGLTNSVYAFGLLNIEGKVQPSLFEPVLGFEGSWREAGAKIEARWRLLAMPGDWKNAFEHASGRIFGVRDYRAPVNVSLSDAVRNMKTLMEDAAASGWDAPKRGFYDIETPSMSKHAAPLTLLSLARLFDDEKFWSERALPAIEFTLSRRTAHYIHADKDRSGNPARAQLHVPTEFYGTAYWQGVDWLTGGLNPWLREFVLPNGEVKASRNYNTAPAWTEELAAWRQRPDPARLARVRELADEFIAKEVLGPKTEPVSFDMFYNIHFYPYWWELVDLYEVTRERRYLEAAEDAAFQTLAGLWSHPAIPGGEMTIHAGGQQETIERVWWRDGAEFRLGWPRKAGDTPEHKVPAWQVAQAGLGLEQPSTLTGSRSAMRNIMMSCWAPHMLRLYQHTGRPIHLAQARNGVIGRFANYPGYYLSLYTDVAHDPKYPYKGPDLTSFYYHHIPVQEGWAIDFLVAQLAQRSGDLVRFPYAVQKGYAWFTFRVYGGAPGDVYGDKTAGLAFDREGLVRPDTCEVDCLAARGADRYYVFLMSQRREAKPVKVRLDPKGLGAAMDAPWRVRDAAGKIAEVKAAEEVSIEIPAMGLATLEIPCAPAKARAAVPPIETGHVKVALGGDWGEAHAFRIRSPFGKDSVYVVVTAADAARGSVALQVEGDAKAAQKCEKAPFEFSIRPVETDRDLKLEIGVFDERGKPVATAALALPGTGGTK